MKWILWWICNHDFIPGESGFEMKTVKLYWIISVNSKILSKDVILVSKHEMIIIEYRRFGLEVLFHYTLFSFTVDSSHIHMYVHKILIFFLRKVSMQTFVPSKDTNMFQFFCVSNSTHLILEIFRIYVNTNINGMNLGHFWIVFTSIIETYKLLSECYYLL